MNRNHLANIGNTTYPLACTINGNHYQLPPLTWARGIAVEPGDCFPHHNDIAKGAITPLELQTHNAAHLRLLRQRLEAGLFVDCGLVYIVRKGRCRRNVYGQIVSPRPVEFDTVTTFMGEPIAVAHINDTHISFSYLDWMYCGPIPFLYGDKSLTTPFTAYKMA